MNCLIRKISEIVVKIVCHYEAHQRFYLQIIERDRLYYDRHDQLEASLARRRMPISMEMIVLPCLIQVAMIGRSVFSIVWGELLSLEDRVLYGIEIYAGGGRVQIEYCGLTAAVLYLLSVVNEISRKESDFQYLAIWSLARESEHVGPWQLAKADHSRLVAYRNRIATLETSICLTDLPVAFVSLFLSPMLTKQKSIYALYPLISWFWVIFVVIWSAYSRRTVYGTPLRFTVVGYCLHLKQRALLERLKRLGNRIQTTSSITSRLKALYRVDRRLATELAAYNRFWSGQLSILLEAYAILITYLGFVIFWANLPTSFYGVFVSIFAVHCLLLSMLAYICVRLVRLDRSISDQFRRFYVWTLDEPRHGNFSRIRLNNMANNQSHDTKRGFLIWNEIIINSSYCLQILASIVGVFLLTIKHQTIKYA